VPRIRIRRVYEPSVRADGYRVLVDRLWPRGLSKQEAKVDLWLKDAAPSDKLRRWFAHDPARWEEFIRRYHLELKGKSEALEPLRAAARKKTVTLVYAATNQEQNNAVALMRFLAS
jgi:uncharacterized protein YeaO (DUF488 family)